jgi:hypothetical protein
MRSNEAEDSLEVVWNCRGVSAVELGRYNKRMCRVEARIEGIDKGVAKLMGGIDA